VRLAGILSSVAITDADAPVRLIANEDKGSSAGEVKGQRKLSTSALKLPDRRVTISLAKW
jgi:hypothetical protein